MFCSKCGAYNDDNAKSCSVCQFVFFDDAANAEDENTGAIRNESGDTVSANSKLFDMRTTIPENPPKTYFWFSVILSVLGSIPFGTAALILSTVTDVNIEQGNIKIAEKYSNKTKLFCIISLIVGIVKYISIIFWIKFYSARA